MIIISQCTIESLQDANEYCKRFRPVPPVVYNRARLLEQPTPDNEFNFNIQNYDENNDEEYSDIGSDENGLIENEHNESENESNDSMNNENEHAETGLSENERNENDHAEIEHVIVDNAIDEHHEIEYDIEIEERKFGLPTVHMDERDTEALDMLLIEGNITDIEASNQNDESNANKNDCQVNANNHPTAIQVCDGEVTNMTENVNLNSTTDMPAQLEQNMDNAEDSNGSRNENLINLAVINNDEQDQMNIRNYVPTENETLTINEKGETEITKTLEDDIEIRYILGQKLRGISHPYQVKNDDLLSGNLPFQENVSNKIKRFK